jgi:hypothetical protein
MYFFPETMGFHIDTKEDDNETKEDDDENKSSQHENQLIKKDEVHDDIEAAKKKSIPLKPYRGFLDVMNTMNVKFGYNDGKLSTALDLISLYLKGQKMLYLEAKSYCEFYLYRLMIPAIIISSASSVISGIFYDNTTAVKIVSATSAANTVILSLVNFYKLDAKAEAHKMTAYSFDQLISDCEFTSGKILLSNVTQKTEESQFDQQFFRDYICKIEGKIKEVKEKNQFIIPATIRERYPTVCNCNIFMDVLHLRTLKTPIFI